MRPYAIEVQQLSKVYRLYQNPSDRLKEALFRKPLHLAYESLKDISFAVPQGGALGIIGENGAGKSTLLKILAKTLTHTQGELKITGRVAALLELGAGFHPEFTGRQNIYLNASLMGLSQSEIRQKEEEIVDFAELGIFIDRPIKIYSSGMVVRLAFSIATTIDPDVLIIDEALSVGDQYFQKKCIDRMLSFQENGKTLVFCSHAMYTVNMLCSDVIWLEKGRVRMHGRPSEVIAAYENCLRARSAEKDASSEQLPPAGPVHIKSVALNDSEDPVVLGYKQNLHVRISFESWLDKPFMLALGIERNDGLLCHAVSMARDNLKPLEVTGPGEILFSYHELPFFHGEFVVIVHILDDTGLHCYHTKASAPLKILPPYSWQNEMGLLDIRHEWHTKEDPQ